MKVGILTFHWSRNYGAALQTYALKKYLDSLNIETIVIDYYGNYKANKKTFVNIVKDFILKILLIPEYKYINIQKNNFNEFRNNYFNLSKKCSNSLDLSKLKFDYIIFGSDQIWNPNITGGKLDPIYFAAFDTDAKCIAYAASIGEKKINENDKPFIKEYLKKFTAISVREEQIINEIKELTTTDVVNVLDPTLLLDNSEYSNMASERIINEPYILIYQNTRNDEIYKIAKKIAKEKKMKVIEVAYRKQFPYTGVQVIEYAGPKEFLSLYKYSQYIVTNTFHGTVFAIQFKKEFVSIPLSRRETRVLNIAHKLGLEDRLVTKYNEESIQKIINQKIEYKDVYLKLQNERTKSYEFLNKSLKYENKRG